MDIIRLSTGTPVLVLDPGVLLGDSSLADVVDRIELTHGRVALRVSDGRFLATRTDRLGCGLGPDVALTPAATFEEILWPDGKVSLRTNELTYLGALAGRVVANRVETGPGEQWEVERIPESQVHGFEPSRSHEPLPKVFSMPSQALQVEWRGVAHSPSDRP